MKINKNSKWASFHIETEHGLWYLYVRLGRWEFERGTL